MKKRKKFFLWGTVVILTLCLLTAPLITPDIKASGKDLFLYKMSGASLFLIWLLGIIMELDVFHIKEKIPLVKSSHIGPHIIFWLILVIASVTSFGVIYNLTSSDFRNAMEAANANKNASDNIAGTNPEVINDIAKLPTESVDVKHGENKSSSESLPENQSTQANEETNSGTASKLIEDETYDFDDAVFVVNGIQLTVHSITLHREHKPEGYSLEVAYSLLNQNTTNATFEFSSQSGNDFILEGQKARMTKQTAYSNGHCTDYHLKAQEKTDTLIGDFYAFSSSVEKMINGESFKAVDISNLYTGQNLTIHFQINGICDGQTETMAISFDIDL